MTSLCRHLSAQEIVNWVTTADACVHTDDTTKLSPTSCEFMYTPPTRRDSTVSSRRRRRCVLGFSGIPSHSYGTSLAISYHIISYSTFLRRQFKNTGAAAINQTYGITQCYLPPDTSERAPPSPQPVGRYSIYLITAL